jgi:integrase/recombinase XerC/integrase/recombinase XerD
VVASIYREAYNDELIERDPCARVMRPKVDAASQRREVLGALELAAYLKTARELGPSEHAIAALAVMGLRASEMASLRVEGLSQSRGYTILNFMGNGGRTARMPVPLPALSAIDAAVDGRESGPLLRTQAGAGMDRRAVHRYVARTAKAAGISRPISPHALLRSVATAALDHGIPLRDVQRMLRHVRSDSTMRSYDIPGDQVERHASHQIAGILAGFAS